VKVSLTFAGGLVITLAVAFTVVKYLTTPLRQQLQELCGNAERAAFWTSFSNVMLVLTPAVFAMLVDPWAGACDPPLVGVVSRVKWGLIGLAIVSPDAGPRFRPLHSPSTRTPSLSSCRTETGR
jgi:uncharacterized membrane protein YhaH (DUF805 family)